MTSDQLLEMLAKGPVHTARIVEAKALPAFGLMRAYGCVEVVTAENGKPQARITAAGTLALSRLNREGRTNG